MIIYPLSLQMSLDADTFQCADEEGVHRHQFADDNRAPRYAAPETPG